MENETAKRWLLRLMEALNITERRNDAGDSGFGLSGQRLCFASPR
jgi:hypothetical protein